MHSLRREATSCADLFPSAIGTQHGDWGLSYVGVWRPDFWHLRLCVSDVVARLDCHGACCALYRAPSLRTSRLRQLHNSRLIEPNDRRKSRSADVLKISAPLPFRWLEPSSNRASCCKISITLIMPRRRVLSAIAWFRQLAQYNHARRTIHRSHPVLRRFLLLPAGRSSSPRIVCCGSSSATPWQASQ